MTHDPITKTHLGTHRLWTRDDQLPDHWIMQFCGDAESIRRAYCDIGIHIPYAERLILPADQVPCGRPALCQICGRLSGIACDTDAGRMLLCWDCYDRTRKAGE